MQGFQVTCLTYSVTGTDAYGNDVPGYASSQVMALAFVPGTTSETTEGTEQVTGNAEIYFPAGTVISALDRVQVGSDVYEIQGGSSSWQSPFTGFAGPVMARLRRVQGATALETAVREGA